MNCIKTEILVFSSSYRTHPSLDSLYILLENVRCSTTARNIGVNFSDSLSMVPHVTALNLCKSTFFHLRNILKIRTFLSFDSARTLVHAFITSRVDYCNLLLYGQPKCVLRDFQRVWNCSARLIHSTSKFDHVTPLLLNLLWLPVEQRIIFKIALVILKALFAAAPSYIAELIKPYKPGRTFPSLFVCRRIEHYTVS